jgi:hypothetical protein
MDCKTARLLLEFARPRTGEMEPAALAALERHLADCPDCDSLARAEQGVDRAFARAMQAVEVPAGLHNRLLARLVRERGDVYLRWFGRAGRVTAAAAAVLVAAWAVQAWRQSHLPAVNVEAAWKEAQNRMVAPPSGDVLAAHFRRLGYDGGFPQNLNYSLLTYYGMGEFQGRPVPQLIFITPNGGKHAEVRLLSPKQFNLTNLPADSQSPPGYPCKIEVWADSAGCAEVVDYMGESAGWLRVERPAD